MHGSSPKLHPAKDGETLAFYNHVARLPFNSGLVLGIFYEIILVDWVFSYILCVFYPDHFQCHSRQ